MFVVVVVVLFFFLSIEICILEIQKSESSYLTFGKTL